IGAERRVDRLVALAQTRGAVDVHRRADGGGDLGERHAVAEELVRLSEETCLADRYRQRGTLLYPIRNVSGFLCGVDRGRRSADPALSQGRSTRLGRDR